MDLNQKVFAFIFDIEKNKESIKTIIIEAIKDLGPDDRCFLSGGNQVLKRVGQFVSEIANLKDDNIDLGLHLKDTIEILGKQAKDFECHVFLFLDTKSKEKDYSLSKCENWARKNNLDCKFYIFDVASLYQKIEGFSLEKVDNLKEIIEGFNGKTN